MPNEEERMRNESRALSLAVLMAVVWAAPKAAGQSLLWSARYDSGGVDALGSGRPFAVDSSGLTTIAGRSDSYYLMVRLDDTGATVRDRIEAMEVPFSPSEVLVDSGGDALWAGIRGRSDDSNDAASVRRLHLEGAQSEVFRAFAALLTSSVGQTVVSAGYDGATFVGHVSNFQYCGSSTKVSRVGSGTWPVLGAIISRGTCGSVSRVGQIAPDPTGGAVASVLQPGPDSALNLVRMDATGEVVWSRAVPVIGAPNLVRVDGAGNAYASGPAMDGGFATVKLDPSGTLVWARYVQGATLLLDEPTGLAVDAGGSVYVSGPHHGEGRSSGDIITVKYDAAGNLLWSQIYDSGGDDVPAGLAMDSAGNVWVAGRAGSNAIVTLRYGADGAASAPLLFSTTTTPNVGGVALDGVGNATVAATVGGDILVLRYGWPRTDAGPLGFYTLPPCRVMDTREAALGGPDPLPASTERTLSLADRCGIPPAAEAVSLNVTALAATDPGYVSMFRAGSGPSLTSVLNYGNGRTVANNAVIGLANGADLGVRVNQGGGSVHVIIDVNGYFADGRN